jgi:hypothetical protein
MTTGREVETLQAPQTDQTRFCPYHGEAVLLADCPIVATNKEVNARAGAKQKNRAEEETVHPYSFSAEVGAGGNGGTDTRAQQSIDAEPGASGRATVQVLADVEAKAGQLIESRVDGWERLVVAERPGYLFQRFHRVPELKAPVVLARPYGGAVVRPARACPICLHPLPATIDYRDTYPTVLVGHLGASKTSMVLAFMEEAGRNEPKTFGVRNFSPTEATTEYLLSIDKEIFVKFRKNEMLERTQENAIHPPLEFLTTIGLNGPSASLLIHDISGETLRNRNKRLEQAPSVLWADTIVFIYNPENSPVMDSEGLTGQANILNGIFDDLSLRGSNDSLGNPYVVPPLLFVISKADLIPNCPDLRQGSYTDADVHAALRALGDQAVINAANRFPTVHWRLMAPMPAQGGGPQGVVDVLSLLLRLIQ